MQHILSPELNPDWVVSAMPFHGWVPFQSMSVIEWVLLAVAVMCGLALTGSWRIRQRDLEPMPDWADPDVFSIVWYAVALVLVLVAAIPMFEVRVVLLGLVLAAEAAAVIAYAVWRARYERVARTGSSQ